MVSWSHGSNGHASVVFAGYCFSQCGLLFYLSMGNYQSAHAHFDSITACGGFFSGWLIDVFYNTHGLHAFGTVLVALLRPTFFRILTPANGYDERSEISLAEMKWLWFFSYVGLMLVTHHLVLFLFEASDFALFGLSLLRAISSAILGILVFGLLEFFNRGQ